MRLVAKCGGGVNTWAMLVILAESGRRPDAIVMADPGDEWVETHKYRDTVGAAWLDRVGFPRVTVVSRASEAPYRSRRIRKTESLFEECERLEYPPSAAFGLKKCSMVYKAEPSFWWLQRQPWAAEEFASGRRISVAIGYDFEERHRWEGKEEFTSNATERLWSFPVYPLVESKITRVGCEEIIRRAIGPLPPKSACMRCPNNRLADWYRLAELEPEIYMRAVDLSRRSEKNIYHDSVGFLRNAGPGFSLSGKPLRKLHVWHDGGYPTAPPPPIPGQTAAIQEDADGDEGDRDELPCECAL